MGSYQPNAFGLHDVIGNVREWCRESFALYKFKARPGDGERINPASPLRAFRGGSFHFPAEVARSAHRYALDPNRAQDDLGLRPSLFLRR